MRTWNYRLIGGLAVLLLVGAVLVPILIERAKPAAAPAPEATLQPTTMAAEVRLPNATAPPTGTPTGTPTIGTTGKPSTARPKTDPVASATPDGIGARGAGASGEIRVPKSARPLPGRDVPPGVLAYATNCSGAGPCWSWRLVDWKGTHWALPKGTAVSLSPAGRRIAWFQPDGRFVVRDLDSGAVDQPLQVPRQLLDVLDPHVTWSPNGRWLTIDYETNPAVETDAHRRAVLLDTTTMRVRTLGIDCCVTGLQSTGDWLLTYDLYGSAPNVFHLEDAVTGRTIRTIDPKALYDLRWAKGRTGYPLSPDGKQFAIFLWNRDAGWHGIGLVDTSGKVTGRQRLESDASWGDLIGWPDVRTIAAVTENNGQVMTYDIQTRKLRAAYTFLDPPDRLTVAVSLVRAQ